MSVKTRTDELIEEVRQEVYNTRKKLEEAIDADTWGARDFKDEHIEKIEKYISQLRKMERGL